VPVSNFKTIEMKKIILSIRERKRVLEHQWNALSLKKQQQYTRILFIAYFLLTVIVLLQVCSEVTQLENKIRIEHIKAPELPGIKSPASMEDTVSIIIKNKIYERI
jgi:hypothetical protein